MQRKYKIKAQSYGPSLDTLHPLFVYLPMSFLFFSPSLLVTFGIIFNSFPVMFSFSGPICVSDV